jgi:hypothetical protein
VRNYYEECKEILKSFQLVILQHIPREHNEEANKLAQSASGYRESQEVFSEEVCAFGSDLAEDDWRRDRGAYPKKLGRWKDFLRRTVAKSFGIPIRFDWFGCVEVGVFFGSGTIKVTV